MSRIKPANQPEQADAALDGIDGLNYETAEILAYRPEIAAAIVNLGTALQSRGTLPHRLTELVRLRIAFHNQCRSCMSIRYHPDEVDEGLVCSLERPEEADDLTEPERAALGFADLMATDHLAIDETVLDDLRRHFDEGEIVELGMHCANYVGFGRLAATWAMHDHLHERYRAEQGEPYTPWGPGALAP